MYDGLKKTATVIFLAVISAIMALVFYLNIPEHWQMENPFAKVVAIVMMYYLLFIFSRTIILLALSFIEYVFVQKGKMLTNFPLVTVIIPAYNEEVGIKDAIESVLKINYPNIEVLVIDDGSSDKTFEIAKEIEKDIVNVRVIHQPNSGKWAALNTGIDQAYGEFYVCMDADSILSENLLTESIPYFQEDKNLAAIAGSVKVGNANNLLTKLQKLEYIIGLNFYKMAQSCLNMVTIVPGPIGIFRKKFVTEIGGYQSDTFAEDCDLSMRLLIAGRNIKYLSKVTSTTEAPNDFKSLITQRYRWSRGMVQSVIKCTKHLKGNFSFRGLIVVLYMFLETVFIPVINFSFIMITLEFALLYGITDLMGPYFLGLILLDLALCLYSIIMEREVTMLFFLGAISRITYGLSLEVIRFLSIFDELFSLPMKWGVLVRKGMR